MISRRALMAGGAALLAGGRTFAQDTSETMTAAPQTLKLAKQSLSIAGQDYPAFYIRGADRVHFVRGGGFLTQVENHLKVPALLHWHGLNVPQGQDGSVPGEEPLKPGKGKLYDFVINRSGTHLMRASTGLLQQLLLAAPLIVRDIDELAVGEQDVVMFLQDYTLRSPEDILKEVKTGVAPSGGFMGTIGLGGKPKAVLQPEGGIIALDAYLANRRTLDDPEVIGVEAGQPLRLRIINACAATSMLVDFGRLDGIIIALDGHPVSPLSVREVAIAPGQRADVRVSVPTPGAFPVIAKAEGLNAACAIVLATSGADVPKLEAPVNKVAILNEFAIAARPFGADAPPDRVADVKATFDIGGKPGPGFNINGNQEEAGVLLKAKLGQRVEIAIRNQSAVSQVLHMHGHSFQVRGAQGTRFAGPMRDTLAVLAGTRALISFDVENAGLWPFASSHLYHRLAGVQGLIACEG
jgi:FtsP/CotA-like multicopper oxidase with cupredoxin domain